MPRIAAISLATIDGLLESNYARALRLVEIALEGGPDIVLLPEAFAAGYPQLPPSGSLEAFAEDPTASAYLTALRQLSARGRCLLLTGYLERNPAHPARPFNAARLFDAGRDAGVHYKSSLWPDDHRPYRDERALLSPGPGSTIFPTRWGRIAVQICYENMIPANWDTLAGRCDMVLSPYNCQGDPSCHNVDAARRLGLPSAWADRTGTVYAGTYWQPNPGTAGIVDARGNVLAVSASGVEAIVTASL